MFEVFILLFNAFLWNFTPFIAKIQSQALTAGNCPSLRYKNQILAFHGIKKSNEKKQKIIIIVEKNLKAFEIIDRTCTIASISNTFRFACVICACYICRGIFCIRQHLSKKNMRKEWKMGFGFYSGVKREIKKTCLRFPGFMWFSCWTCESTRYFFLICSRWHSKYYLKHTP